MAGYTSNLPTVEQPSPADSERWVASLREQVQLLELYTTTSIKGDDFGNMALRDFGADSDFHQSLGEARRRLGVAEGMSRHLGLILCSSGINTYTSSQKESVKSHLDWGLVEIDESRLPPDPDATVNVRDPFPISSIQALLFLYLSFIVIRSMLFWESQVTNLLP